MEDGNNKAEIVARKENTLTKDRGSLPSSARAITSELGLFDIQRPHTDGIITLNRYRIKRREVRTQTNRTQSIIVHLHK